jgi:hypothetical protein
MAVPEIAAADKDAIGSCLQSFQNEEWTYSTAAHHANNMNVGNTFEP